MSSMTTASTSGRRRPRSANVRTREVAGSPWITVMSAGRTSDLVNETPDAWDVWLRLGSVISIGALGDTFKPWSQAAVLPENTACLGSRILCSWTIGISTCTGQSSCEFVGASAQPVNEECAEKGRKTPQIRANQHTLLERINLLPS